MPELPEVETVVRDLRPHLVGRRFVSVRAGAKALRFSWDPQWAKLLVGRRVADVTRRGKWIVILLEAGPVLVVHLGMTGQLRVFDPADDVEDHTHLTFGTDGPELRFRDVRRFGSATVFADAAALERFFAASRLGPEPFDLDGRYWVEQLAATRRPVKAALLDQRLVAGVGNIYADEALFEAKLPPDRRACDLTAAEARRLGQAVAKVLTRAVEKRGSTIRDYVGGSGLKGGYQEEFRVYGRTGEPCRRCRTAIVCVRLAGRSTHFCPNCQKGQAL